jgi:hypothetical protein
LETAALVVQVEIFFQHLQAISETATPLPNGIVQTIAATMAAVNVNDPRFILNGLSLYGKTIAQVYVITYNGSRND